MENNIRKIRKLKGLTLKQLAEPLNTSTQQIGYLETGKRKLSQEWMVKIAGVLHCDASELIAKSYTLPNGAEPFKDGLLSLAVLGNVQAGHFLEAEQTQVPLEELPHIDIPRPNKYAAEDHFLLKVIGDSMNKRIPDGYFAVCVNCHGIGHDFPVNGDIVVVERSKYEGQMKEVTIKRFDSLDGRVMLIPESHDPKFETIFPDTESEAGTEVKIVAKVVNAISAGF